jgi:hypothetical protein
MRITLNQLKRIIKEEVTKATKRSRKLQEAPVVDETDLHFLEFTFISPEDEDDFEDQYPNYRGTGFVLVCDEPEKCAKDLLNRVTAKGALTDYEFQEGVLAGYDYGLVVYGTPDELLQTGHIFAKLDHELGGGGFAFDPSDVPELVKEKMQAA